MKKLFDKYKTRGWAYIWNLIHIYFPIKFITRSSILKANNTWRLFNKYKKKYRRLLTDSEMYSTDRQDRSENEFRMWTLWLQGEENAPLLVRKCIQSIRKYYGERLIVLDRETIGDYITVPEYIKEKYESGFISHAHYSDIIRTLLLCHHGGIWIDCTCLMTDSIPDEIFNSKLFVFRTPKLYPGSLKISNWFILAEKGSSTMALMKDMLLEYWRTHKHMEYYFMFHILFSIAIGATEKTRKEWEEMPYYSNEVAHLLKREMLNDFKQERFDNICKMSTIHKLNWKKKNTGPNTYLSHICDLKTNFI